MTSIIYVFTWHPWLGGRIHIVYLMFCWYLEVVGELGLKLKLTKLPTISVKSWWHPVGARRLLSSLRDSSNWIILNVELCKLFRLYLSNSDVVNVLQIFSQFETDSNRCISSSEMYVEMLTIVKPTKLTNVDIIAIYTRYCYTVSITSCQGKTTWIQLKMRLNFSIVKSVCEMNLKF